MPLTRSALLSLVLILLAVPALAEDFPMPTESYSADVKIQSTPEKGEAMIVNGKVYWTPKKERREMRTSQGETILIFRHDKNLHWMLMPQQKMYMEMNAGRRNEQNPDPSGDWRKGNVKVEKQGTETVNGVKATKYKVISKDEKGRQSGGDLWVESHNVPVRMKGFGDEGVEFQLDHTNLKFGKQPDSLFEVPEGYQKFNMGGGMMGMPGGMGPGMRGQGSDDAAPALPPGMGPGMTQEQAEEFKKRMQEMEKKMRERYGQ